MTDDQQARIKQLIGNIQVEFGDSVGALLQEVNHIRLKDNGTLLAKAAVERDSIRWTLEWHEGPIQFDLNVVAAIEDDGRYAKIARVWVQRHATTPLDYDGHTPTTRMRRLTALSLAEIREAIEAEWG
ncbi:MAG: hypothetical protein HY868_15365 [Chloroflexi bacterium]|nr:hypothetical protein [Chloroflexota bacterium]